VQQYTLTRGLARPHQTQARPARGGLGPAQLRGVFDQQEGAGGLQLLAHVLAVSRLQRIRDGLSVPQQLAGGFAGVDLPLAQAGNTGP